MSTLLTDNKTPAAGGTPPATPAPNATPSSGEAPKPGEQTAAGKEPAADANKAPPAGKDEGNTGGKAPEGTPKPFTYKPSPDGSEVGEEPSTALTAVAQELNLSNEAAQKIVDKVAPALVKQQQRNVTTMIDGWIAESKTEFGTKLDETLAFAKKGLELCPPELRQLLGPVSEGGTGLGNHKAVIAGFAAIGRKVSPDTRFVGGSPPSPPPKSAMERLAATYESQSS